MRSQAEKLLRCPLSPTPLNCSFRKLNDEVTVTVAGKMGVALANKTLGIFVGRQICKWLCPRMTGGHKATRRGSLRETSISQAGHSTTPHTPVHSGASPWPHKTKCFRVSLSCFLLLQLSLQLWVALWLFGGDWQGFAPYCFSGEQLCCRKKLPGL